VAADFTFNAARSAISDADLSRALKGGGSVEFLYYSLEWDHGHFSKYWDFRDDWPAHRLQDRS
jgi:hypothetical protein